MTIQNEAGADVAAPEGGLSRRAVELTVAALLMALALMVLWDSYDRGAGWTGAGPENGFFPARIGWIFLAGAGVVLVNAVRQPPGVFVSWQQLGQVMRVLVPLVIFVALIKPLGIYVSSALFIIGFMLIAGSRNKVAILLAAALVPLVAFWIFELQFRVPLPKGPLEAFLGY
ncbi:hypothetical protein GCM10007301_29740 [Azorhizobium oxalatiphilum]|uniref:DUF1468 domain-containing protein n=1 Tax=Azorhizobium oxalatiphilum TaxID=980631 RepID=A0A917C200_9HYPH|nr:tripartite tricarboxylate transporter TctB family protein [Azorhizobium oxalatiphilum]GGF68096.1 hypothetical protein GCM10007301_29740 [Azorhizobium oxalatiphilum]